MPRSAPSAPVLHPGRAASPALPVELWPVTRLRLRARRVRDNAAAVPAVTGSLTRYGWQQPIVVRPDGEIVAGEAVWQAAQAAGYTEVPVHVTADLTDAEARAYALDDNRTHDEAHWHYPRLQAELTGLAAVGVAAGALSFPFDELGQIAALAAGDGLPEPEPPRGFTPTGFVALNVPVTPPQRELLVSLLRLLVAQGVAASYADALERICREWVARQPPPRPPATAAV